MFVLSIQLHNKKLFILALILFYHLKGDKKTEKERGNVSDYLLIKGVNEVCEGC